MYQTLKLHPKALMLSVVLHLLLIALTMLEFNTQAEPKPAVSKRGLIDQTIKAEVVDQKQLDKREQEIKQQLADKKKRQQEQNRLDQMAKKRAQELKKSKAQEAEKKAEAEKKRQAEAAELKKAEAAKKKVEDARKRELEASRKAEAEEKRKVEEAARKAEQQKRELELARQKAEEEKRKQEEARIQAETEARLKAEAEQRRKEAELKAQIAAEERQRELDSKRNRYYSQIRDKISRNWRQPANAGNKPLCEVRVVQGPGGIILDVTFGECPGTREYRLSVEAAVLKSDPLPDPEDKELFERNIILKFKPNE